MIKQTLKKLILTLVAVIPTLYVSAVTTQASRAYTIKGVVVDANNNQPIEFATIAVYTVSEHTLAGGGITNQAGEFTLKNIPDGNYSIEVAFMGYVTAKKEIEVPGSGANIGKIKLRPDVKQIATVDVVYDRASVDYKIDKKVVNVGQQLSALSGTAIDVLENVPSIKVDIDGNVSMRGSSSFTVLIDGRPTPLDATDALRQIPASSIENIEIITNPSAKYEPDGASGVLNIVTKKNSLNGFSGIFNVGLGIPKRLNGDFVLDYRAGKWHYFIGANGRIYESQPESERTRWVGDDSLRTYTISSGKSQRRNNGWGLSGGMDYAIKENAVLGFNFRYGNHTNDNDNRMDYLTYSELNGLSQHDSSTYVSNGNSSNGGKFKSVGLYYSQSFDTKEHTLDIQFNMNGRNNDGDSENSMEDENGDTYYGQKNNQSGPGNGYRFKVDYVRPVGATSKLSAGAQGRFMPSDDKYDVEMFNAETKRYEHKDDYSYETKYLRQTYSLYAMFASEWGNFGYQGGLRGEYTYQDLELSGANGTYHFSDFAVFPTAHVSYELPADQQVMLSYTRRINRARPWQLQPYVTWQDAYNVRRGNPELEPEYVNSIDFGYQKKFGDNFVALDAYYRMTQSKIERIQTIYEGYSDVIMNTTRNVGSDYAAGAELTLNYSPIKWYQLNLMGDVYNYRKEGVYDNIDFSQHSFNWNMRMNNVFKIGNDTRVQIDVNYRSKSVTSQGYEKAFLATSFAVKQELFGRKLTATFQARNLFNTIKRERVTEGPGFYTCNTFRPQWPNLSVTLSYKMNNYRSKDLNDEPTNSEMGFE